MKKKVFVTMLSLLTVLTLTGCQKDATIKNGEQVIVELKDESYSITADELFNELKKEYGINKVIEKVDNLILNELYPTDAAEDAEVEKRYQEAVSQYGNETAFLSLLKNYGYQTLDEYKEVLRNNYKVELATKDYIRNNITDAEIEKYYNNEIKGDLNCSHILISYQKDEDKTDDENTEARNTAIELVEEVLAKLAEEGADFATIAKEYSNDKATASNGGKLGRFTQGQMVEEFENAARKLKVGEYTTKYVETSYGFHIIKLEETFEKPQLKEVRENIIEKLIDEKNEADDKAQYKAMIELREKYGMKFNDSDLEEYYNNAKNNWLYSE